MRAVLWVLALAPVVLGYCPNRCSNRGYCNSYNVCECQEDYFGHDCSLRKCPMAKSWGVIRGDNQAHEYEECSGRGICDYKYGQCTCQLGFTGFACEVTQCPASCSDQGNCVTMKELASDSTLARDLYDHAGFAYNLVWDYDKIRGCQCDFGHHGPTCKLLTCPVGDDPLTTGQVDESQVIECLTTYSEQVLTLRANNALSAGSFILEFGNEYTRPIAFDAADSGGAAGSSVTDHLSGISDIDAVTVTKTQVSVTETQWLLSFPLSNAVQTPVKPKWKVLETQRFICAADSGTFSMSFGGETVYGISYDADGATFAAHLESFSYVDQVAVTFAEGATTVCSTSGTVIFVQFTELWRRDLYGDLPPMTFTNADSDGTVSLFLSGGDGFVDEESTEIVKGIDTCRVVEVQQLICAATDGNFALTFEDNTVLSDIAYNTKASQLEALIESQVPYAKDVDVSVSVGNRVCSDDGTIITIQFHVVSTTGANMDGDLAEISADETNEGSNGLSHSESQLQFSSSFTETQKGTVCEPLDVSYSASPDEQIIAPVTTGGGSFTVTYRGMTSAPIPATSTPEELQEILEKLHTIQGVSIQYSGTRACEKPSNAIKLTFTQNFGNLPTVVLDPTLMVAGSTVSVVSAAGGLNGLVPADGTKESIPCSGRGLCDEINFGACLCYSGYTNSDGRGGIGMPDMNRGDCGYASQIPVSCPGELACSGHGVCSGDPEYKCTCAVGWRGGDCSERVCQSGPAWFAYPEDDNVGHREQKECSGVGSCDRSSGLCICPNPYTGAACERMSCGGASSECSGHGRCLPLQLLAPQVKEKGEVAGYEYGEDPNDAHTWDAKRIRSCLCDEGYTGYDCSLRHCPRGDDPSTYDDVIERQLFECVATDGSFTLSFRDEETQAIAFDATVETVATALMTLSTISQVDVTFTNGAAACSVSTNTILVDFLDELGDLPALKGSNSLLKDSVNGDGTDGSGTLLFASGGSALSAEQSVKGTRENAYCSNHGICNLATGVCTCDVGYGSSNGNGEPGPIGDCGYRIGT